MAHHQHWLCYPSHANHRTMVQQDQSLQTLIDGVGVVVCQLKGLGVYLSGYWVGQSDHWGHSLQASGETMFPMCVGNLAISVLGWDQLFWWEGMALLGSARGRNCSVSTLYLKSWFNTRFTWAPVLTWTININTDPTKAEPQFQTWPTAATWAQVSPWNWMASYMPHWSAWAHEQLCSGIPIWSWVSVGIPSTPVPPDGSKIHIPDTQQLPML